MNNDKKWFKAVVDGNMEVIDEMLNGGYDINMKNDHDDDKTALMMATWNNHLELVIKLLNKGADVNACDHCTHDTVIYYARSSLMLDTLLSHGVKIKVKNKNKFTPLMTAAYNGEVEVVDWFLSLGVDANAKDNNRCTALYYAAEKGNLEIVNMLVEGGADINEKCGYHDKPIFMAAIMHGNLNVLERLIELGVNIEEKDNDGMTALMYLVKYGNDHIKNDHLIIEMINKLVEYGANINAKDNNGMTALMHVKSSQKIVERLIELGANIKEKDNEGCNAFMYSLITPKREIVDILAASGEKLRHFDLNAYLRLASKHWRYDHMEKTIARGASIETLDEKDIHHHLYNSICHYSRYYGHDLGIKYNLADALLGRVVDFTKMTLKDRKKVKKYLNKRYGNIIMVLYDKINTHDGTGNNYNVLEKIMDNYCPNWRVIMDENELYKLIEESNIKSL
jgi:ankyrin repeat protein/RNAse (barnase) inhibitor barstar